MAKEPFLMNPHLGIINPRKRGRKKGKKSMARRSSKAHMAYVRSFRKNAKRRRPTIRRKRRARRNPWPVAGAVLANPRRRRSVRRRRTHAVARRRRSGYSRNPRLLGLELPPLNKVLFAGVGFVVPPMLEGVITGFVPASISSSTIGKYAVRVAAVLGLAFGIRKFIGREEGNMAAIGGGVYVLSHVAAEFLPNLFGSAAAASQVSMYVPSSRQLMAYVPANQRIQGTGMGNASAFSDDAYSGAIGGTAVRFKR